MGDLFHSTDASQSATNQQIGISTRDVGGSVITVGHGAASNGGTVNIQSLDPAALNVAAMAVHDALAANTATSLSAFQAYQQALTVAGETATGALQVASSGAGQGAIIVPASGSAQATQAASPLNPSTLIWVGAAIVAAILVIGYLRK